MEAIDLSRVVGLWVYPIVIVLMMIGLYIVMAHENLIKKIMGLNIFQVSVIMFYVALGKVRGGTPPILDLEGPWRETVYSNPLPHVLMLTAIVVGIATTALGLSLVVRIQEAYGTTEEDEITRMDAPGNPMDGSESRLDGPENRMDAPEA